MKDSLKDFCDEVLMRFREQISGITDDITDRVFLMIQGDKQLMQVYNDLAPDAKSRHALNAFLGRKIREHFSVDNIGRCHNPKSRLIKSYERHQKT